MLRHPVLLDRDRTGLLVVDIQEKILAVTSRSKQVVENAVKLIKGFKILERPIFITEQYPEGLGNTVDPVKKVLEEAEIHQKLTFSCCGIEGLTRQIRTQKIDQLVLCGIESHVCVLQTAIDLKEAGYTPVVVMDCISSRKLDNVDLAAERFRHEGIMMTSYESILFELTRSAGAPEFKAISKLVK